MKPGDVVVIGAFDEVPEHWFRVEEVLEDCVTGFAITGPLAGEYGEPDLAMILRVLTPEEVRLGTQQSL
jgi:hypothetical protein